MFPNYDDEKRRRNKEVETEPDQVLDPYQSDDSEGGETLASSSCRGARGWNELHSDNHYRMYPKPEGGIHCKKEIVNRTQAIWKSLPSTLKTTHEEFFSKFMEEKFETMYPKPAELITKLKKGTLMSWASAWKLKQDQLTKEALKKKKKCKLPAHVAGKKQDE